MQQQAVAPPTSRFEPSVAPYANFLRTISLRPGLPPFAAAARQQFQHALERLDDASPAAATLYQLGVAALLEALRTVKKQSGAPTEVAMANGTAAITATERAQQWTVLQTALAKLPEARRRVVALHLMGLSPQASADLLGWSAARLRLQLARGERDLRAKLPKQETNLTEEAMKTLLQTQPARTELQRVDCLAGDFLARAGAGDLSDADRLFIAEHLTTCPDCSEEYELVRAVKAWAETAGTSPDATNSDTPSRAPDTTQAAEPIAVAAEPVVTGWRAWPAHFVHYTGFNLFTGAVASLFLVTSLSLATWLVAQYFKHQAQLAEIRRQQQFAILQTPAEDEPVTAETLQARVEAAQKQLSDLQAQLSEQNADKVLSNQELLGIQNDTLQKELQDLAQPQLDAPVVDIDPGKLPKPTDSGKEVVTTIDVPPTAALFTVILHKPADKVYPSYLLELLDPKKPKPLWSGVKKQTAEPMTLTLSLLRRNYPAGKYRLRLSGVDGKKKDLLDTYNLEVKYASLPKATKKKR